MKNNELINQLYQIHASGFDYIHGSVRQDEFEKYGYFCFDFLTEDEYIKERKKDWKRSGSKRTFKKWDEENEDDSYIYIMEEINLREFDISEILDFAMNPLPVITEEEDEAFYF